MELITAFVRKTMEPIAAILHKISHGHITPSMITTISLVGHLPVAWAIVMGKPVLGAVLLLLFAGMDALDGTLARVQGTASATGMLYDAVSDRMKEIIVFSALAVYVFEYNIDTYVWLVVAACGTSLLVSFVKAKGEVALSSMSTQDIQKLNRTFGFGIASYQNRTVALIIGLLFGWIPLILPIIIALNLLTAAQRFLAVVSVLASENKQ